MKRLLGAFIILVLLFSLCACDDSPKETQLQTTEEEITEPGFIELTTENIADYLAFDYYCNDFHSQPGAVELLCITTRPRQPGKFYDCWIHIRATMEDGTTGSDSIAIPIDGEISEGLEAHKLYMPARVVDVEIRAVRGRFFPE